MSGPPLRIGELLAGGSRSFSFEFFPPKDEAGEEVLWRSISELEPLRPTFVSVTYGAGGTTRDRTIAITGRIARETTPAPDGAPDLRRAHHRRADPDPRVADRVRGPQRARAAGRPGGRPRHGVGAHARWHRLRLGAGGVHPRDRRPLHRRRGLPRGAPRRALRRGRRGRAQGQAGRRRGVRGDRDGAARLGLLRARRAGARRRRRVPDHPGHHADPGHRLDEQDGRALRAGTCPRRCSPGSSR